MKTKLHHWLIACTLILGLYACSEPTKTPENTQNNLIEPNRLAAEPAHQCHQCDSTPPGDGSKCAGDRWVKVSCIEQWMSDWKSQLEAISMDSTHNTQRTFSVANLDLLHKDCDTCDVRIYYGIDPGKNGKRSLVLGIVNVDPTSCDDKYYRSKSVLVHSWSDDKDQQSFMPIATMKTFVQNWSDAFYKDGQTVYLPTVSLTMKGDKFWSIVKQSSDAITCHLTSHVVNEDCMIEVYRPWPEGPAQRTAIDLVIRPDRGPLKDTEKEFLDFAAPCPKACGGIMLQKAD